MGADEIGTKDLNQRPPEESGENHGLRKEPKAFVDRAKCFGCGACTTVCKPGAITVDMRKATVDPSKCTGCGLCLDKCAVKVISMMADC